MTYSWDFGAVLRHGDMLWQGFVNTAILTVLCLAFAIPAGLLLALMRLSKSRVVKGISFAYVNLLRATPALVLIVWFFFAFPVLVNVEMTAMEAAFLAVGLQAAAYMGEVFRGGILAIRRTQWEAASAIGLSRLDTLRFVILPQAVRLMLPVFFIRAAEVVKATTLASVISYGETVYMASQISVETYRPLETFTIVALLFFVLIGAITNLPGQLARLAARS